MKRSETVYIKLVTNLNLLQDDTTFLLTIVVCLFCAFMLTLP